MSKKVTKFIHVFYQNYRRLPDWRTTIEDTIFRELKLSKAKFNIVPLARDSENKIVVELAGEMAFDVEDVESKIIKSLRELEFESALDKFRVKLIEEHAARIERWEREEGTRRKEWEETFFRAYQGGLQEFRRSADKRREWESAEGLRRIEFETSIVKENQVRDLWEKVQKGKIYAALFFSILSLLGVTWMFFNV